MWGAEAPSSLNRVGNNYDTRNVPTPQQGELEAIKKRAKISSVRGCLVDR